MADADWTVAPYLEDRASPAQQETLGTVFGGKAGGHPAHLAEFIGELRAVEAVPIKFELDGRKGNIRIGEVGEAKAEPIDGQDGMAPALENHPLAVAPGYPAVVAKTSRAHFDDHGIALDVSDRNALLSPFSYAGP